MQWDKVVEAMAEIDELRMSVRCVLGYQRQIGSIGAPHECADIFGGAFSYRATSHRDDWSWLRDSVSQLKDLAHKAAESYRAEAASSTQYHGKFAVWCRSEGYKSYEKLSEMERYEYIATGHGSWAHHGSHGPYDTKAQAAEQARWLGARNDKRPCPKHGHVLPGAVFAEFVSARAHRAAEAARQVESKCADLLAVI